MNKKAVILINVGTPDKPETGPVRNYLSQFLNDGRVMDMPWLLRKILVNLIIVPFRAPKSAKLYKQLWQEDGSPLLKYSTKLASKVQKILGDDIKVFTAMRYGNPGLKPILKQIKAEKYDEVILCPLFPQYASSTTGTALDFALNEIKTWYIIPKIKSVKPFYANSLFLNAFKERASEYDLSKYEHIIFSYHGLPLSQINKSHPDISESSCGCTEKMPAHGKYCYKAECYETARLLAAKLGLEKQQYTVAFQSRFADKWLSPFTDDLIKKKANEGVKNILVFAPAFVADCLETLVEIEIEYAELFKQNGGKSLDLVHSLNDSDVWAEALSGIIKSS